MMQAMASANGMAAVVSTSSRVNASLRNGGMAALCARRVVEDKRRAAKNRDKKPLQGAVSCRCFPMGLASKHVGHTGIGAALVVSRR